MKRPAVSDRYPYLYRTWPLIFWRKCELCEEEFRRQKGWRFLAGPWHGGNGRWRYMCGECVRTEAGASMVAHMWGDMRPPRPPPSPSPPRRLPA